MKLYTYFRSSAAYRVRIALNLKGLAYDAVPVNLLKGEQRGEAYRAVNPQGRVPSLHVGEAVLLQSSAILEYLDEVYPEPPLLPADPVERARVRAVAGIVGCDIHPLNNSSSLAYLKTELGHGEAETDRWYAHWVRQGFEAIEALLDPAPFAFGSRPTMADLYLVPQVFNARRFRIALDAYPKILAADEACARHPAFEAAHPSRQPDAA